MPTETDGDSADFLQRLSADDSQAADEVFRRYATRLLLLAKSRLSENLARRVDPEDIAMSAWRSFFGGARQGRFHWQRSGDLWRLLVAITIHKIQRTSRRHLAAKRDLRREDHPARHEGDEFPRITDYREPSPIEVATFCDEFHALLKSLDPIAQQVLERRLEGATLEEIAAALDRSERTIRRVLETLRTAMTKRLSEQADD